MLPTLLFRKVGTFGFSHSTIWNFLIQVSFIRNLPFLLALGHSQSRYCPSRSANILRPKEVWLSCGRQGGLDFLDWFPGTWTHILQEFTKIILESGTRVLVQSVVFYHLFVRHGVKFPFPALFMPLWVLHFLAAQWLDFRRKMQWNVFLSIAWS